MKNSKTRKITFLAMLMLCILSLPCYSQTHQAAKRVIKVDFAKEFKSRDYYEVLLGCMLYSRSVTKKLEIDNQKFFLDLSAKMISLLASNSDKGQVIDNYVNKNSKVDFRSTWAIHRIKWFAENYDIISNKVFADVTSDDKSTEMKKVKNKIFKVPELKAIYQSYLDGRPDMSSLSSNEGNSLYIQMSYYLGVQTVANRNAILKMLL